jgi:thioredoxin-like negative regulator of GroEL
MSKQIISVIENRKSFLLLLENNPGLIIIKFGASWCGPCKLIQNSVNGFFASSPPEVICADIDVDESFDLYSFLKSKKMINGIPAILCFKKGNKTYIPDDMITGADSSQLHQFFIRCGKHLNDALIKNP